MNINEIPKNINGMQLKKLLNDNNNKINVPIKDKNGEIEWNGEKYSLEKMEVTKC